MLSQQYIDSCHDMVPTASISTYNIQILCSASVVETLIGDNRVKDDSYAATILNLSISILFLHVTCPCRAEPCGLSGTKNLGDCLVIFFLYHKRLLNCKKKKEHSPLLESLGSVWLLLGLFFFILEFF